MIEKAINQDISISVIVPTLNRYSSLNLVIHSLVTQCFPSEKFEILIIDNGSIDETKIVSKKFMKQCISHNIRYIWETEPGLLSGRHRGALEAKGNILTFVDDDIEADKNWLRAIEESFKDPSVQLVGGRNLPRYEVEPPEWLAWFWKEHLYGRYCSHLSLLDFGDRVLEIDANFVWGLNFSIRKKALSELGGFHPDCIPKHLQHFQGDGETGLTRKAKQLNYKAIYQPRALVFHQVTKDRMTYEYFDKRYFYQGICDSYTQVRNHGSPEKMDLNQRVIELKKKIKGFLKEVKQKIFPTKLSANQILNRRFHKAYLKGYQFHQNAVRKNPRLLDWILKENYWDYKLPELISNQPERC